MGSLSRSTMEHRHWHNMFYRSSCEYCILFRSLRRQGLGLISRLETIPWGQTGCRGLLQVPFPCLPASLSLSHRTSNRSFTIYPTGSTISIKAIPTTTSTVNPSRHTHTSHISRHATNGSTVSCMQTTIDFRPSTQPVVLPKL